MIKEFYKVLLQDIVNDVPSLQLVIKWDESEYEDRVSTKLIVLKSDVVISEIKYSQLSTESNIDQRYYFLFKQVLLSGLINLTCDSKFIKPSVNIMP